MSEKKATAPSGTCKKTRRVMLGTVKVGNGQHLHYFITVQGDTPVFSLSCRHKTHFNAKTLGARKKNYEVIWPGTSGDEEPAQDGEAYSFSMSFAAALKYTLRLELHDSNHQLVGDGLIIDADYESENALALCNEAFIVRTKS
jgi:hypothetical protein